VAAVVLSGQVNGNLSELEESGNNTADEIASRANAPVGQRPGRVFAEDYPFVVLLAVNEAGFANMTKLVSRAHLTPQGGDLPHVHLDLLASMAQGLILLSGGPEGPLNCEFTQGRESVARSRAKQLLDIFGDRFYIELQRHEGDERAVEKQLLDTAYDLKIPLVATNQVYFATADDHEAHDALICIAGGNVVGQDDRRQVSVDHYFKSRAQMMELFDDLPEALANSVEIARRCIYRTATRKPILPSFTVENGGAEKGLSEFEQLEKQSEKGLEARLSAHGLAEGFKRKDYDDRLKFELSVIEEMGFPGYFLIVADFIIWAKQRDIPVGPGRGSGAGSVVAWALEITDLDPLQFGLMFERFLNPERLSMPDFDIDFCQDRREEVIHYVQQKYGEDRVAQIITFGTLQARAVLRDVGRVLQMPYGQVDRLCKLVPANPANPVTLAQAVDGEPKLMEARREEEIVEKLFSISLRLEGLYRHASTHAAGIVIGDRKLEELVPLYRDPRSEMPVSQYNMKWVEPAGLVKFDFLGLKTLTVLKQAVTFIGQKGGTINLSELPIDDVPTYEMLAKGETVGVFQFESAGMRKALIGMRPDRFEDLIALGALYRPGPMDNIPTYNARKNGEEEPDYYHPKLEGILEETYGVIIYQEQVLQIARVLSGYTLGEADFLRKAMGKKIKSEMDAQRTRFVEGAVERDTSENQANEIFDVLAKFAGYGFNKAHSTAYALIAYQTAYLKCHYPVEFLAASMQLDMGNTDKLSVFHQDARQQEIEIINPSVQVSRIGFSVKDDKVVYALAAIKGVGEGAVEQIIAEREENGEFTSLTDFFSRVDSRQLNRRTVENLICAGAFDCFDHPRERMAAGLDRLLGHAQRTIQDRERGQSDMFGGEEASEIELPRVDPWLPSQKLQREHQSVGFYLSAHPLDEYRSVLEGLRVQLFGEFEKSVRAGSAAGRLAGTVTARQERNTRTGKRMAVVMISDPSGQYEAVIFEENLNRYRDLLEPGQSIIILAAADMRPEGVSIRIQSVQSLEKEANRVQQDLRIFLRDALPLDNVASLIKGRGDGKVSFVLVQDNGAREVEVQLKSKAQVTNRLASALKAVPGVLDVELV
ncbi:MAG: DNA polymerase III subunit alpha, partial [Rhizobiaceae bacterium]|nr:DNA polymerase III subunit alpha [Rhizobiaceae bacterium]